MKKTINTLSAAILITAAAPSFSDSQSFHTPQIIEPLHVGEVHSSYGDDGGNTVYVKFKDINNPNGDHGYYYLNRTYNLNDSPDASILATLRTAFFLRAPVQLWDHHGNTCDDFDEVAIYRD